MNAQNHIPRILSIAGSDSGGGAGIQADLKTIEAFGGFGMTAITALTAQNTLGVQGVHTVPAAFVEQQINSVLNDIGVDAVKIGMLGTKSVIEAVAKAIKDLKVPIIIDPVMIATSGDMLLETEAIALLKQSLLPQATVLTPNIPEAEKLICRRIKTVKDMKSAAKQLSVLGPSAILIKGGHLQQQDLVDILYFDDQFLEIRTPKIETRNTHGTGCTYAAAIACLLGRGTDLEKAARLAHDYVQRAIETAPGFGQGHGPLLHGS